MVIRKAPLQEKGFRQTGKPRHNIKTQNHGKNQLLKGASRQGLNKYLS